MTLRLPRDPEAMRDAIVRYLEREAAEWRSEVTGKNAIFDNLARARSAALNNAANTLRAAAIEPGETT